jgi:hypothetical protein
MANIKKILFFLILLVVSSCVSPLTKQEKKQLSQWKNNNFYVEEKKTSLGVGLGFLPGGGSFYGREYTIGIVNLLLWPVSILWDPISGYNATQQINYNATQDNVNHLSRKEEKELDSMLQLEVINKETYIIKKRSIDEKYYNY